MILSLLYLVLLFGAFHVYWLGEPFQSRLSLIITAYLFICTWAFPYILKAAGPRIEAALKSPLGFLLWSVICIVYYLISPILYVSFKFF